MPLLALVIAVGQAVSVPAVVFDAAGVVGGELVRVLFFFDLIALYLLAQPAAQRVIQVGTAFKLVVGCVVVELDQLVQGIVGIAPDVTGLGIVAFGTVALGVVLIAFMFAEAYPVVRPAVGLAFRRLSVWLDQVEVGLLPALANGFGPVLGSGLWCVCRWPGVAGSIKSSVLSCAIFVTQTRCA